MGSCKLNPPMGSNSSVDRIEDKQNALSKLSKRTLERDDTQTIYPHRIYRDNEGSIYHSITHILSQTAPKEQKEALEKWLERPTSYQDRDVACERGTLMHNHAEYLLKTASKLARNSANRRNVWKTGKDGLERCPKAITKWALEKAAESAPEIAWSASGYTRSLRSWILERVTAIHAIEFSIHRDNFAGTADALVDIDGDGPFIVDWKSRLRERSEELLHSYCCQAGAYHLGLKSLTNIECKGAYIVVARRTGKPQERKLSYLELKGAEQSFLERNSIYQANLKLVNFQ